MANDEQEKNEEEKDSELDLLAEQELIRLTRQYRVIYHAPNHLPHFLHFVQIYLLILRRMISIMPLFGIIMPSNQNFWVVYDRIWDKY